MRLNHVMLRCADVGRSIAFYQGLGLRPIVMEPGPDGAPRYARLRFPRGDATLSLERAADEAVDDATAGAAAPPAGGTVLYFECDELDRRVAALADAGYVIAQGPEMKPWLWREATLADPDGHEVRLYHAGSYRLDPPWRLPGTPGETEPVEATSDGADEPEEVDQAEQADQAQIDGFATARNRGYADAPIPSGRDEQIAAYLTALIGRGAEARERAAARLGPAFTGTLLAFAERMATQAARERSAPSALHGLVAVALAWREAPDVRAAIPVLAVLHDAAARAGADPAALFVEAASLAPSDVAPVFRDFLTRPDLDEIAAEMGYAAGRDRDGFRYRRKWGAGRIDSDDSDSGDDGD